VEGDALEVIVRFAPSAARVVGVKVRCSPDGAEGVEIGFDREARRLMDAPLALGAEEDLELRVFVDRSVIEVFANGRACHTARFYPERDDCTRVALFTRGGGAQLLGVRAWEMRPIAS
jgi:beta-fructofuranosidase